jgi:two-component system OmpR family response regulator
MTMATILIVDDDADVRSALSLALRREGHTAALAESAAAAARAVQEIQLQPDLVILEPSLPGTPAFEVCRGLRAQTTAPIIILTSRSDELDKVVGLELGADDYVTKPFGMRELLARVKAHLRRATHTPRPDSEQRLTVGNFHVDLSTSEVLRGERAIKLRPRELDLLVFLMRNAGRTFSREQLLSQIWGYAAVGRTRTVDVHINRIRMKIEDDPANPRWLISSRGMGYRFEP